MATTTYEFTCEWCQKNVVLTGRAASKAKRRKQRFCSGKCYRESLSRKIASSTYEFVCKNPYCGKHISLNGYRAKQARDGGRRFCSRRCFHRYRSLTYQPVTYEYTCANPACGKHHLLLGEEAYEARGGRYKYCDRKCAGEAKRNRVAVECLNCGQGFEIPLSCLKKGEGKFCSIDCWREYSRLNNTYEFTCMWCGENKVLTGNAAYNSRYAKQRFCSRSCANSWVANKARVEKYANFNGTVKHISPNSRLIPLNKCKVAIVDVDLYETVTRYTWGANSIDGNFYARTTIDGKNVLLHRLIAEFVIDRPLRRNEVVHHVDENPLNNKRNNLLICTIGYHNWLHNRMKQRQRKGLGEVKKAA